MNTRADVLDCKIDRLDMPGTVARIDRLIAARGFTQHVAINTAKLVAMRDDPALSEIIRGCGLVSADGQGVVWASRLLGDPLPERVAGIDLMHELLALAAHRGHRVYFLGAQEAVLERALERLRKLYPALIVAGSHHGYFSADDVTALCRGVRETKPDIVFVAMSTPQKEYFLGEHGPRLGAPFVMGVGGAIDVVAGVTRRAPLAWQRLGLEWLFRLLQEPRRMFRRYAMTNGRFAGMLLRALLSSRGTRDSAPEGT
jgi:N-acetylglucosaminyldiphosphoundecaprenol N-acetyl-beta-D-mannosaminyltransferase